MDAGRLVPFGAYVAGRDDLLGGIVAGLSADERFGAAWLTGSFGRREEDALSDLDLSVLTTPAGRELLEDTALRGGTSKARKILFEQFGVPVIIHENPYNAQSGSSFDVVVYRNGPYTVDWTLLPAGHGQRPLDSLVLFDHVGVATLPPVVPVRGPALSTRLEERWSFFWMMAVVTAKYWLRRDEVLVVVMLDQLERIAEDIRRLVSDEPLRYRAASRLDLPRSLPDQAASLQRVCMYVDSLRPRLAEVASSPPQSGRSVVEVLMRLGE